jgi:putative flavoprotein involved in K+ transport
MPGVYVLGLPWLYTWGSGRFVGVGRDAGFLADRIVEHLAATTELAASRSDHVTARKRNRDGPLALSRSTRGSNG